MRHPVEDTTEIQGRQCQVPALRKGYQALIKGITGD